MSASPWGALVGLGLVWALVPWPLARWAAAFVGLWLGLGALWSLVLSRGLVATAPDRVLRTFSGRRVDVVTKVENRTPLPSGVLFVSDSSGGLETWGHTRHFVAVRGFTRLRLGFSVRGRERGERLLGPLTVKGCDPTGVFSFTVQDPARTLVVYPPVRPVEGWPLRGVPPGPRRWEPAPVDDPSRFRTYREFRDGDPLVRISAAAWARTGVPQVRTYDRTVARPSAVVVDLRAELYPLKLRWALVEAAVETAASLVWDLLGRGETVWLTVVDAHPVTLGPAQGWASARGLLERLALARPALARPALATPDKDSGAFEVPPAVPPGAQRLLWVGPVIPTVVGREVVGFVVGGEVHGPVAHP